MTEDEEKYPNRVAHGQATYPTSWSFTVGEYMADLLDNTKETLVADPFPNVVASLYRGEFGEAVDCTLDEIGTILISKHNDYGPGNIMDSIVGPETALLVRLSDKFARLKNLHKLATNPENESYRDTVVDIAGYAVLLLMVMDGSFPRE